MCACMCIHIHTLIHIHASKLKVDVKMCTLDYTFYFHKKLVKVSFKTCGSRTSPVAQWVRSAANAGDTDSTPGPGRFHMMWSN